MQALTGTLWTEEISSSSTSYNKTKKTLFIVIAVVVMVLWPTLSVAGNPKILNPSEGSKTQVPYKKTDKNNNKFKFPVNPCQGILNEIKYAYIAMKVDHLVFSHWDEKRRINSKDYRIEFWKWVDLFNGSSCNASDLNELLVKCQHKLEKIAARRIKSRGKQKYAKNLMLEK